MKTAFLIMVLVALWILWRILWNIAMNQHLIARNQVKLSEVLKEIRDKIYGEVK